MRRTLPRYATYTRGHVGARAARCPPAWSRHGQGGARIGYLGLVPALALGALGVLHLYWVGGGRRGLAVALPQRDGRALFTPSKATTLAVALLLFAAALLVSGAVAGWAAPFPWWDYRRGALAVAVVFLLRALGDFRLVGFTKRVRGTPFARWDTALFSPLCAVLGILILLALRC